MIYLCSWLEVTRQALCCIWRLHEKSVCVLLNSASLIPCGLTLVSTTFQNYWTAWMGKNAFVLIVTVNRTNGTRMLGLMASLLACSEVRILYNLPWSGGNFNPCIVKPSLTKQGAYIPNYCYEHFLGACLVAPLRHKKRAWFKNMIKTFDPRAKLNFGFQLQLDHFQDFAIRRLHILDL